MLADAEFAARLRTFLDVADRWVRGMATTGEAIRTSREVHRLARLAPDQASLSVARSVGHAVATPHMADHSLGAALYALQAVGRAGGSVADERLYQKTELDERGTGIAEVVNLEMKAKRRAIRETGHWE